MMRAILELTWKDLMIELRRPHEISSALLFTFASVFTLGLSSTDAPSAIRSVYPAIIWIILYFASTFIFASSFLSEADQGTIRGLRSLPFSMNLVLYGKALYCFILLSLTMTMLMISSAVFLGVRLGTLSLVVLGIVFLVSAAGFSLLGCLTSAMLMFSEGRRLLIVFVLLPISLPILIPCISSTRKIVEGLTFWDIVPEMQLILAFTIIIYLVSSLGFESIISE